MKEVSYVMPNNYEVDNKKYKIKLKNVKINIKRPESACRTPKTILSPKAQRPQSGMS